MSSQIKPLSGCRLSRPAVICPLGDDLDAIASALFQGQRGLSVSDRFTPGRALALGMVHSAVPDPGNWHSRHRSRNNQLLAAALQQLQPQIDALRHRQPQARIGIVLGTSTSGIGETEQALARHDGEQWPEDFHYLRQEIGSPADFLASLLGTDGPAHTLSTACTSGAMALASARRMLAAGSCDAVIAGGADSLCGLTVNGFSALGAMSDTECMPFSRHRRGINLGEAAALFLVTNEPGGIQLAGYGESSDAHHFSAPHPEGLGAIAAMQSALRMANCTPGDVSYLNLHGTATQQNDSMEALAVHQVFGAALPCSSTKALTGHTLGACGALEAAFCWLALEADKLPPHVSDGRIDPALPVLNYARSGPLKGHRVMSNSFAFGGNNTALLLERLDG